MIDEMEQLVEILDLPVSDTLFVHLREMLMDPSKTLAGRLYKESEKSSQSQVATSIAKENYQKVMGEAISISRVY